MSKKKDRQDTNYRYCPMCGGKQIIVYLSKKIFKYKKYIYCYKCQKNIEIKEIYLKKNLEKLEIENVRWGNGRFYL